MLRVVKTENGLVKGLPAADPRITSFKGIPFGAPPVGKLRFHAPMPVDNWEGVKECYQFAPISMQSIPGLDQDNIYTGEWNVDPDIPMSEDCLYLNVWTPAKREDENLPVFVWFFGGALQYGNTAEMEFDGERLARRGVVVVTVNYRINVFGFIAHKEITKESPQAPANFGHLDQRQGLLWTKKNIAAFGGDPENITIGGQSAGGASVLAQLNCPWNKGIVKRAIVESGIFHFVGESCGFPEKVNILNSRSLEEAERKGEEFFHFLGVNSLEEARNLSAEYIRDKNDEFRQFWGTVTDGAFQTQSYWESIHKGELLDIPVLTGYTNNEFIEVNQSGEKISTIELAIRLWKRKCEENAMKAPFYVYEFAATIPGADNPGAFHSSDLWFFFETLAKCSRPFVGEHYDLARKMCDYWAEFIKKGNPNGLYQSGLELEKWTPFTETLPHIMTFTGQPKEAVKFGDSLTEKILNILSK